MLGECQARPAACDAALASPERRAKDCRHWETAFERPGARRNVRVPQPKHLRGRPGVRGLRRHRPGPEGRAQSPDGRTHRLSGSPELSTPARDLVVRGFRPMRTQLLLDSTPPTRRRSTSPPRILSSESPRGRPGSPPPKSRTLEATRSRPRDQGTGPVVNSPAPEAEVDGSFRPRSPTTLPLAGLLGRRARGGARGSVRRGRACRHPR